MNAPLKDQIKCVKREIAMRTHVYAKRVNNGYMSKQEAEKELDAMTSVLHTLLEVQKQQNNNNER